VYTPSSDLSSRYRDHGRCLEASVSTTPPLLLCDVQRLYQEIPQARDLASKALAPDSHSLPPQPADRDGPVTHSTARNNARTTLTCTCQIRSRPRSSSESRVHVATRRRLGLSTRWRVYQHSVGAATTYLPSQPLAHPRGSSASRAEHRHPQRARERREGIHLVARCRRDTGGKSVSTRHEGTGLRRRGCRDACARTRTADPGRKGSMRLSRELGDLPCEEASWERNPGICWYTVWFDRRLNSGHETTSLALETVVRMVMSQSNSLRMLVIGVTERFSPVVVSRRCR